MTGVSFLVPVRNGAATLAATLDSIWAQADGRPFEIIVVDDRSTDSSVHLVRQLGNTLPITIIRGEGRGAAAALNLGFRAARYPLIAQVDQDVVLDDGWLSALLRVLEDPHVAASQGRYVTDTRAPLFERIMGRDLEERYAALHSNTDHVCTGNTVYRAEALEAVGGFDERLGYGYDNDLSYRLIAAGHQLRFCADARSLHRWRGGLTGYLRQQYGFGYGRLDLIAKHPQRTSGDAVSSWMMMLHPAVMFAAFLAGLTGFLVDDPVSTAAFGTAASLVLLLTAERTLVGARCARRFGDATALLFPFAHAVRDMAWVAAILVWGVRRLGGEQGKPAHSMMPRSVLVEPSRVPAVAVPVNRERGERLLVIIPAFNEARNLPAVVAELRTRHPRLPIAVVDDGSTDDTREVLTALAVRRLHLPRRMGVGIAIRVGLRYAARNGFTVVVRLDGDGQHSPEDIPRLLQPLRAGKADVVLGSRSAATGPVSFGLGRLLRRPLAACLSLVSGHRVTDPTCGFCALGPGAIRLLAEHHPTGYPEAELRLLLSRTALTTVEVPVASRARLSGKTSLTPIRILLAAARVVLAMCVEPLRRAEPELARD